MSNIRRLSRYFRFYEKKRGGRRTGSEQAGSLGLTLFFLAMLLGGTAALVVAFFRLALPEWRVNRHYQEARCRVLAARVGTNQASGVDTYRPEVRIEYPLEGSRHYRRWTYDVSWTYGPGRQAAEEGLAEFTVGGEYPCWYDPDAPGNVVVVRGYTSYAWLVMLLPVPFIMIGFAGVSHRVLNWRTSAEHRSALARKASSMAPAEAALAGGQFPNIPRDAGLTDSPGTTLAYRLPVSGSGSWPLVAVLGGCVAWNLLVVAFVVLSAVSLVQGERDYLLLSATLAFAVLGGWLLLIGLGHFKRAVSVGRTLVEVSDHPLYPGARYEVLLAQYGRLRIKSLHMLLVCEEKATYSQGTNTRTEIRRVYEQEVLSERDLTIEPGAPLEIEGEMLIPASAMHSFRANHNEVSWNVVIEGEPARWPRFERRFAVVVYPSPEGTVR